MGITAIPPSGGGGSPRRVRSAEEIETRSAVLWPFDFLDSRLHYACCAGNRTRYIGSSVSVSAVRFVGTLQETGTTSGDRVGCALGISGGQGSSARGLFVVWMLGPSLDEALSSTRKTAINSFSFFWCFLLSLCRVFVV